MNKFIRVLTIGSVFLINTMAFQNCSKFQSSQESRTGFSSTSDPNNPASNNPNGNPSNPTGGQPDPVTFEPNGMLKPILDPNRPDLAGRFTDEYEIKYVETREDEHLKLNLLKANDMLYITETGSKLRTVTYTLNGWTDMIDASQLNNEPVYPYRLYHLEKWSAEIDTLDEYWRTVPAIPKPNEPPPPPPPQAKRSELIFYIVKKGDNWNPVGQSNNPIGKPYVFSKLPEFKLINRTLQFEYKFVDESEARLKALNIEPKKNSDLRLIYSQPLLTFIQKNNLSRGFHDFTREECISYADTLPTGGILAFDIEPPEGKYWIIDYSGSNYLRNLEYVVQRLKEKGTIAYDWMHSSPAHLELDGKNLSLYDFFGSEGGLSNHLIPKFKEAYGKINQLKKNNNFYQVVNIGFGYTNYDTNLSPLDEGKQNFGPQLTYLRSLNSGELWKRAYPDVAQINFTWPYQEYYIMRFPGNHVVDVPSQNARARRIGDKPLYPPNQVEDNMTLAFVNSKHAYYWSPNLVSWDPANVSYYNKDHVTDKSFYIWEYEYGTTPKSDKAYLGKEATTINSSLQAAYNFSKVQHAADGSKYSAAFKYKRANKDGSTSGSIDVGRIDDGSWYMDALIKKQPFCIILTNNGKSVVMFQDVWSRPGRWTEFEFSVNGKVYKAKTEGNRLFTAVL